MLLPQNLLLVLISIIFIISNNKDGVLAISNIKARLKNVGSFHLDNYIKHQKNIPLQLNTNKASTVLNSLNQNALLETNAQVKDKLWFHLDNYMAKQHKAGGTSQLNHKNKGVLNFQSGKDTHSGTNDPKSGGSTNLVRNHNYMSVMETADGRAIDPDVAREQFKLQRAKEALKREAIERRKAQEREREREKKAKEQLLSRRHQEESTKASKSRVKREVKEAQELAQQTNERHRREFLAKQHQQKHDKNQITLSKGFSIVGNEWQKPTARVWNSLCFVNGVIKHTVSAQSKGEKDVLVGHLPDNCHPQHRMIFSVAQTVSEEDHEHDTSMARIDVTPNGDVFWMENGLDQSGLLSLDGIVFSIPHGSQLHLEDNWHSYGTHSELAPPTIRIFNDIIVLGGTVHTDSSEWHEIANLPNEASPANNIVLLGNNNNIVTNLKVTPNGKLEYFGGGERQWLSLDGIIYPKRGGIPLPLTNGWQNFRNNFRIARHHRIGELCFVSGMVAKNGSWQKGDTILTLPENCRPSYKITVLASNGDKPVRLEIDNNGQIKYIYGHHSNSNWLSLDTIRFLVN